MRKFLFCVVSAILLVSILCSCNEKEKMSYCNSCGGEYLEKYSVQDFLGYEVCPSCIQSQVKKCAEEQAEIINAVREKGEYVSDEYIVVARSECNWCGGFAPSGLCDQNWERICINCISKALQNEKVARAISYYLDYEY